MSIGKRIRFFRKRRGMTQRELGIAVGFPDKTADVRIAQYENGSRFPKSCMRNAIAEALDVSVPALATPEIAHEVELLHLLFALEDRYDLRLSFDGDAVLARLLISAKRGEPLYYKLYFWLVMKQRLETGKISHDEYDDWRYGVY